MRIAGANLGSCMAKIKDRGETQMLKKDTTTLVCILFLATISSVSAQETTYTTTLTSGPFLVAPTAMSVDWVLVNNEESAVDVRVTVYSLNLDGTAKEVVSPGAITLNLAPGAATHNANSVNSVFFPGIYYEVIVEATSDKVHANINQWSSNGGSDFVPGTLIPAGSFVSIKLPKDPRPPK